MNREVLGHRIRLLRERAGLTQEELAQNAHIAQRALQRIEAGEGNPTLETLEGLCLALKVNIGSLFPAIVIDKQKDGKASQVRYRSAAPSVDVLLDIVAHPDRFDSMYVGQALASQFFQAPIAARALSVGMLFGKLEVVEPQIPLLEDLLSKLIRKAHLKKI